MEGNAQTMEGPRTSCWRVDVHINVVDVGARMVEERRAADRGEGQPADVSPGLDPPPDPGQLVSFAEYAYDIQRETTPNKIHFRMQKQTNKR